VEFPAAAPEASYEAAVTSSSPQRASAGLSPRQGPRPCLRKQIAPLRIRATALEEPVYSVCPMPSRQASHRSLTPSLNWRDSRALLARFSPERKLPSPSNSTIQPSPTCAPPRAWCGAEACLRPAPDRECLNKYAEAVGPRFL